MYEQDVIGKLEGGRFNDPMPSSLSALTEAAEGMERAISEAMSTAELLAQRLEPLLRPAPGMGTAGGSEKVRPQCSPFVESANRQRGRLQAVTMQLQDLLARLEV